MRNNTKLLVLDKFEEYSNSPEHTESLRLEMNMLIDEIRGRILEQMDLEEALDYIDATHKNTRFNKVEHG